MIGEYIMARAMIIKKNGTLADKLHNALVYIIKYRYLYLMCIPGLVYLAIFHYTPMYGVIISFKDFSYTKGIMASEWVGFQYFNKVFSTTRFFETFRNSVLLSLLRLVVNMPVPIILALLINEMGNKAAKRISQTVMYLPHFISWVAIGGITITFLSETDGLINMMLKRLTGNTVPFLSSENIFRWLIVGTSIWKEAGWGTIIYLASLSSVNPELYEAATVDGANRFQKLWHISLTGIASTISIQLILQCGNIMNNGFEQIYMFQNPANIGSAEVFETYIYKVGLLNTDFSYSTAVGLFKSVVNVILVIIANRGAKLLGQATFY